MRFDQNRARQLSWQQRLDRSMARPNYRPKAEYSSLKLTLHRKLAAKVSAGTLDTNDEQRFRKDVLVTLVSVLDGLPTLLSSLEKSQIVDEVLEELIRFGRVRDSPLEAFASRLWIVLPNLTSDRYIASIIGDLEERF
jgi:hypothetical protein